MKAGYKGLSHTINDLDYPERNPDEKYDLVRMNSKYGAGLGDEFIHYGKSGGGNSGFQAVNLAYIMGAETIILLGFDMFGSHYFGDHPAGLAQSSPYASFIQSFEAITQDVEIINCSRKTAMNCFPRKDLEDVLS